MINAEMDNRGSQYSFVYFSKHNKTLKMIKSVLGEVFENSKRISLT